MTTPTEPIAIATKVTGTFDDVVTRTRGALAEQGFGILTEIDMQATLKAKLDEDMEKYLILVRSASCCRATSSSAKIRLPRIRSSSKR